MDRINLAFKPGQLAEARSFTVGYRGAWFRCKIKNVRGKDHSMMLFAEYYDFPDEKVRWAKIYGKLGSRNAKLMYRPQYPAFYNEGEVPDTSNISEVAVIVNNAWKEGDLVDWFSDGCYWSGKLTEVLGNDKLKIELFPPPLGEGSSYEVSGKDLRPSLDWSPEYGWTLPKPAGSNDFSSCARLVKLDNQGAVVNLTLQSVDEDTKDLRASDLPNTSVSCLLTSDISEKISKRRVSANSCTEEELLEINECQNERQSSMNKTNYDNASSLKGENGSAESTENGGGKDGHHDNYPSKKMRTEKSISANTMTSDAIEAAILDLEELLNKVKWIKDVFQFGTPLMNAAHSSYEFVEHQPSSS